ncbi:unnamed protein product [Musa banksii]
MENVKERNGLMSVPRFGGWAQKTGTPDYSMVFSRARADKRQRHKIRLNRIDLENESEHIQVQQHEDDGSVKKKKKKKKKKKRKFLDFLNCCLTA